MPQERAKPGPKADVLKISVSVSEGLRRLVQAPPISKSASRYAKGRKPKRTA